jgi:2'-hydroxyisoflavone reductase
VRILVLGGTQFVGRALVEAALAAGDEVTLFHRGRTNPELFPQADHVTGDRDGGLAPLAGRSWDACVDVSGYLPRVVRDAAQLLAGNVDRYVYVSTISVYADLAAPVDEDGRLASLADPGVETVDGDTYGGLKALCEQVVTDVLGDRSTIVRPTYVVGPHDHTGRFTWWVHRGARGGDVVVPASCAWRIQLIDVRDLARFLHGAATGAVPSGTYNAVGPAVETGFVDVLEEAAELAETSVRPVVVEDAFLAEHSVTHAELPLWVPEPGWEAWAQVSGERAIAAGLVHTPLVETIHATLDHAATVDGVGLTPEREAELLAAWSRAA